MLTYKCKKCGKQITKEEHTKYGEQCKGCFVDYIRGINEDAHRRLFPSKK